MRNLEEIVAEVIAAEKAKPRPQSLAHDYQVGFDRGVQAVVDAIHADHKAFMTAQVEWMDWLEDPTHIPALDSIGASDMIADAMAFFRRYPDAHDTHEERWAAFKESDAWKKYYPGRGEQ